jgi:hypothetical protein
MQRYREIAAAPCRTTIEAWAVVSQLLADTIDRSPYIDRHDVDAALELARPAGLLLIAGGHLDKTPIVLLCGAVHLSITTVSGEAALTLEENLNPVLGAASASEWTLYLPTPDPVASEVRRIASSSPHLSIKEPPASASKTAQAEAVSLDRDALLRRK